MVFNFKQFLNENNSNPSPDSLTYNGKLLKMPDNDAFPFVWSESEKKIYVGDAGKSHSILMSVPNDSYPGRIWKDSKIIVFWVYPSEDLFLEMCQSFENDHQIKILHNGWKIVVLKENGEIKRKGENDSNYSTKDWREFVEDKGEYKLKYNPSFIPVEEYVGSEDMPEELYQQHLLSPLQKRGNVITKFPGYQRKKLSFQLPGELEVKARSRMYQESNHFLNERSNINDMVFHRTGLDSLYKILQSGKILLSTSMGGQADLYGKSPYFLSFSRTKNPNLGYSKNTVVSIEFDGRALKTKYKGKSIDYWSSLYRKASPSERAGADEFEDRLFSNSPYLENLEKYIKNIDIILSPNKLEHWKDYIIRMLLKIKELDSPLLKKIRIYKTPNDFLKNKNPISIKKFRMKAPPKDENGYTSREEFDFDLLNKIITLLLLGDKKSNDDEYIEKFIKKYYDKLIELGEKLGSEVTTNKLKNVTEQDIRSLRYDIKQKIEWGLDGNWDFINGMQSRIHNITKSAAKSEINYEVIKILSDELLKYKVNTIEDLIKVKEGNKKDQKIDYSEFYIFVYKRDKEYIVLKNDRENILWWHKLRKYDIDKIFQSLSSNRYNITTKDVINYLFNNYNEDMAKRFINSIMDDEDYILVDTRGKMVYPEILEKGYEDHGQDRGESLCWWGGYIDKDNWYNFLKENVPDFEKVKSRVQKIRDDEDIRTRYVYGVTEKLVGREKAEKYFDDNDFTISREREYMINIGKPVLVPDPNLFIKTNY